MEILQTKVMRGPNYWSTKDHQLIVLIVRLEETDSQLKNNVDLLKDKLEDWQLTLNMSDEGIVAAEVVGRIAVTLQTKAGMDCRFLKASPAEEAGTFHVLFTYTIESVGRYAAQAALKILNTLTTVLIQDVEHDVQELKRLGRREALGPSTRSLVEEASKHNIPVKRLNKSSLIMLGHGRNQRMITAAVASSTSAIAVEVVSDKELTKQLLADGRIPTPRGRLVTRIAEIDDAVSELDFPLAVKPLNGNHGRGITTNIQTLEDAVAAFHLAQKISRYVIIERHIKGYDFRFLVINYKLVAVAKRTPASVTGNGISTIGQLIDESNKDPRRGIGHENVLTQITVDDNTLQILAESNLSLESVLQADQIQYLKYTANLSSGGTADDVTDVVHIENIRMAERVARLMDLDICGIDIMTEDVTIPITKRNGAVLEVNAGPGLRMHLAPSQGMARNVAAPIIEMLFPAGMSSRIPLVAITGTNGKTTTTRLIAHLAKEAGHCVGFTTTDGVFVNDQAIELGDCSGPASSALVLRDPLVSFAVLECARGGILRSGLGFDQCSVSIVTNISEDHLGMNGIHTVEELARVKAVVPKSTSISGYAILNADDDLVYNMKEDLECNVALFSLNDDTDRVQQQLKKGGMAAVVKNGYFCICQGELVHQVVSVTEVPLTFGGTAESMIKNVLPSILAAYIEGISISQIQAGLKSFKPSPQNTPGRMNLFEFKKFKLMVDYAHNEAGYRELKKYADGVRASTKTGILAVAGDRREQDIVKLGNLAADIFDNLIIKHDKNTRGRTREELTDLTLRGVREVWPDMPVVVISDEKDAVQYAIDNAPNDAWIFLNTDEVPETLHFISEIQQKDRELGNSNE
jgi:cyanophycin synthetase